VSSMVMYCGSTPLSSNASLTCPTKPACEK
jgi:hypothetical protein